MHIEYEDRANVEPDHRNSHLSTYFTIKTEQPA